MMVDDGNIGRRCFWSLVGVLGLMSLVFSRCANIVAPTGGPKDTIPPVLIQVSPPDSSLHFNSNKIVFTFDEYVQLSHVNEQLIVSPTLKRQSEIKSKLRTVTVLIKDTLQPNTTYTFNFGDAIEDLDEGNPLYNFSYVVSTGSYLDSLNLSGKVTYAQTGKSDSNILVMLYKKLDDSVVSKEKPLYYTRTDSKGNYVFHHLPSGTFKLFALQGGTSGDLIYDDTTQMIGFADSPVVVHHDLSGQDLLLFSEYLKNSSAATSPIIPPPSGAKEKKIGIPRFTYHFLNGGGLQDLNKTLDIGFNLPIQNLDTTGIFLQQDTNHIPVKFRVIWDTSQNVVHILPMWTEDMDYRVITRKGFATDSAGAEARADTLSFRTKSIDDYGNIELDFSGLQPGLHYVVEVVEGKKIMYSGPMKGNFWKANLVTPGTYDIRLLIDTNQNGHWDNGKYYGHQREPEKVLAIPTPLTVRANWDNQLHVKF
ncbi:MAG: Ig-like domain-containing domain [Chitinophagaceae bacterium]